MTLYLIRHGKSDKTLQDKLTHTQFEFQRALIEGEEQKASKLGTQLKQAGIKPTEIDLVWSGKIHSKQTVLAIAKGMNLTSEEALANLREDFGLTYLAEKEYWHECETAIKNGNYSSHAEFFSGASTSTFDANIFCRLHKTKYAFSAEENDRKKCFFK